MALFSKLYLYESEGDSRGMCRTCQRSSPLVPRQMLIRLLVFETFFAYLELEFRLQVIISTLYYMTVCLE